MSRVIRFSRSRGARRTALTTTSAASVPVIVTRPEKLLSTSLPPGSSFRVRETFSVSSYQRCAADGEEEAASAQIAKAKKYVRMVPLTRAAGQTFVRNPQSAIRNPQSLVPQPPSPRARRVGIKRAAVDCHSDDRVDADRVEIVDFFLCRDAAGGGDATRGRVTDRADRL